MSDSNPASANYSATVDTARNYYNSEDADNFYATIWGGEDIHVGMYDSDSEPIPQASAKTVEAMADKLTLDSSSRVLDIGAGYGGAARHLAKRFGCKVVALNLSEKENERDRKLNAEQGLDHLVSVVDASFEDVPEPDNSFDAVWSQDAILHSGDREKVLAEVARVLKPGGQFIWTDPMMADGCPAGVLQPILDRIHLETLGSPEFYKTTASKLGFVDVTFEDHTNQLVNHYSRVLAETEAREDELRGVVSQDYIDRMKKGLGHWIEGGKKGHLAWGIFTARLSA